MYAKLAQGLLGALGGGGGGGGGLIEMIGDLGGTLVKSITGGDNWGATLADGLSKSIKDAFGTVGKLGGVIVNKLLDGMVGFMGKTGEGLKQIVQGVFAGALSLAGIIMQNLGSILKVGLGIIAKIPEILAFQVGLVVGLGMGLVGALIAKALGSLLNSVIGVLGDVLNQVSQVFAVFGEMFGKVISGVIDVVQDAVMSAIKMSQNVLAIRNNTGVSTEEAAQVYSGLRVSGVSEKTIGGMFNGPQQAPDMFRARARGWGIKGDYRDKDFIPNLAEWYQSQGKQGVAGQLRRQGALKSLNMDNPEMVRVLSTPVSQLKAQQAWQGKVDSSLGMSPKAMEVIGEKISMLIQRFEYFADVAKGRLAQELLPALEAGLNGATEFLKNNAGKIADGIKGAIQWTFTTLPKLLLDAGSYVLGGIASLAGGIAKLFEDFSKGEGVLHSILMPIAKMWDIMMKGVRNFVGFAVGMFHTLKIAFVNMLPKGLKKWATKLLKPVDPKEIPGIVKKTMDGMKMPSAEKGVLSLEKSKGVKVIGESAKWVKDQAGNAKNWVDGLKPGAQEFGANYQKQMVDLTKENNEHAKRTADSVAELAAKSGGDPNAYLENLMVKGMRRARTR